MEKYRFIDKITSDVLFEAYGKDLKEVFANAAEAMFSVICQLDKVEPKQALELEISGKNHEELMFNWLQELIAAVDVEAMFFSRFRILEITEKTLRAKIYGEPIQPEKGETVVKAVTNHEYKFEKTPKGYKVRVILDI